MKIKTSELTGAALDWAVAQCESYPVSMSKTGYLIFCDPLIQCGPRGTQYSPSTNWSQGGPIIEREGIDMLRLRANINNDVEDRGWRAYHTPTREAVTHCYADGPTPLIAAMRCYVASKLGDDVDVPEELT
jgi:hypothetical protein